MRPLRAHRTNHISNVILSKAMRGRFVQETEVQDLGDIIKNRREEVHHHARQGISRLQTVADSVGDKKLIAASRQVQTNLDADRFRLIVVGRFNNGKSTLLNALLGEPERPVDLKGSDLLPSHRRPTTAVLTDIVHSDEPCATIHRFDDSSEQLTLEQFRIDSRVRNTAEENAAFFEPVKRFEVGFPANLLRSVTLSDSPGISDIPVRTSITREAIDESDVALTVYRSETPAGHDELEFAEEVRKSGCRLFTVVNLIPPDRSDDPDLRRFLWDRLVGEWQEREPPTVDDFAKLDIFFVDALAALEGRKAHDPAKLAQSGLPLFERRLADFLLKEKFATHTARFIARAERVADSLEQDLRTREMAHRASAAELRTMIDALKPQIAMVCDQRKALELILERYAGSIAGTAQQAFIGFVQSLREPLEAELSEDRYDLDTLKGGGGAKAIVSKEHRNQIGEELIRHITSILRRRVSEWSSDRDDPNGLIAALEPEFRRLMEEVEAQVRLMDETIKQGRIDLEVGEGDEPLTSFSGISGSIAQRMVGDFGERGKIGALVGGGLASLLVATIGLKISLVIGTVIFTALGVALNPLLILGIVVAAIIGGGGVLSGLGIENSIKKKAVEAVVTELPMNHDAITGLREAVILKYRASIAPLSEAVGAAIEDEERRLSTLVEANEADGSKQTDALNKLSAQFKLVAEARSLLAEARAGLDEAA